MPEWFLNFWSHYNGMSRVLEGVVIAVGVYFGCERIAKAIEKK